MRSISTPTSPIRRRSSRRSFAGGSAARRWCLPQNPDDLSGTFAALREGKSLWGLFLTAVLVALVFETFLSNRFVQHP